ncbi:MAG: tRNA uridine-5-carboxymethylaminomethyl(34) synthesis enzyme MnmG [Mycoplasmoidaceae bacterium]
MIYDCLVIGGGHSGLEAIFSFANQGLKVGLITIDSRLIANMPCNPSIGGPAKGVVTREIDALGGIQGIAADECKIQIKLLNNSKGPGVQALRAQIDKVKYHQYFLNLIKKNKYIDIIEGIAEELIIENNDIKGLLIDGKIYKSKTVIIASGTFLSSKIFIGNEVFQSGPDGFKTTSKLSENLKRLGFEIIRLKTGTPPRIKKDSIDFSKADLDTDNNCNVCFSNFFSKYLPLKKQEKCFLIYTNNDTHNIIKKNISKSALYSGHIKGSGPRYCPSIEDKVIRFCDKNRHQIFIEPESLALDTCYLAGLSTSFSKSIQEKIIKSIPALKNSLIIKYAYAIEYDAINPNQLKHTLESKTINNLYFAGQINGTSGYEEAAAQGIIAGINAANRVLNRPEYIPLRTNSYIGVLIDDIVTKKINDPYRLLTSRCEYRLLIRSDNADDRMIHDGYKNGLIKNNIYQKYLKNFNKMNKNINILKGTLISQIKEFKVDIKKTNINFYDLLKREGYKYENIKKYLKLEKINKIWERKIDIITKYEGYIHSQKKIIRNYEKLANIRLDKIVDYNKIPNISLEARDKLNRLKPENLAQISKIGGINLNDILNIKYFIDKN